MGRTQPSLSADGSQVTPVECEIKHPEFGWVPTSVRPDDDLTADLYAAILGNSDNRPIAPYSGPDPLAEERRVLNPFRMAFRTALSLTNSPIAGVKMLEAIDGIVSAKRAAEPFSDVVRWYDDVQQIVRLHPDIEVVKSEAAAAQGGFVITDEMLDAICRIGVAIDQMQPADDIAALITAANAP